MKTLKKTLLALGIIAGLAAIPWKQVSATITDTDVQTITAMGNGVTTNYTIGFTFTDNDDVQVWLEDQSTTPYTRTAIVYGSGAGKFTITGGDPGTTVVMGTAPASTERVIIKRIMNFTQAVDYDENAAFPAADHEEAMDKSVMLLQQLNSEIGYKVGFSNTSTSSVPTFPDPVANRFIVYNNAASDLTVAPQASSSLTSGDILKFNGSGWETHAFGTSAATWDAHIANTSNPHSVTATQVGNTTAQWNASQIMGKGIDTSAIANGYVLTYNSAADSVIYSSPGTPVLAQSSIFVGDSSNAASAVTMSGDATIADTGVITIGQSAITNTEIADGADIERAKVAAGTVSHVLINDGTTGLMSSEAQLATSRGGTGQDMGSSTGVVTIASGTVTTREIVNADVSASAAIDRSKIATGTAYGVVTNDSSGALTSVAPSTSGNILTSDGTQWVSQAAGEASIPSRSYELSNLGLSATVAGNALTIAVKQSDGSTDPGAGSSAVKIGFRNSTATDGAYYQRSITSALSLIVSSGSTLGHTDGVSNFIYVYALDNAGTVELAAGTVPMLDEGSLVSSTAEGGAGAADSALVLYSTTARTSVPMRLIGRLRSTQATAGTWALGASEISVGQFASVPKKIEITFNTSNGYGSTNTTIRKFTTMTDNGHGHITGANDAADGASVTINTPGLYYMNYMDSLASATSYGISRNSTATIGSVSLTDRLAHTEASAAQTQFISALRWLNAGDVIRFSVGGAIGVDTASRAQAAITKVE